MTTPTRIIAYLYERPTTEGDAMGCEVTYADWPKTHRMDLADMLNTGIVAGDIVRVRSIGDLGRGREAGRIKGLIEGKGATVEECPVQNAPRLRGRKAKLEFETMADHDHACSIWYSPAEKAHALRRIGAIAGGTVDENWCKYRCGNRDGSQQKEKREAAAKRFKE